MELRRLIGSPSEAREAELVAFGHLLVLQREVRRCRGVIAVVDEGGQSEMEEVVSGAFAV